MNGAQMTAILSLNKLAILCITWMSLTACTTSLNGSFCAVYEPVYLDYENDTAETIRQVDRNNVVFERCEK